METAPNWQKYVLPEKRAMNLPRVDEIPNMKLTKLMEWCSKLSLEHKCEGFERAKQYREVLLEYLKETGTMEARPAPLAVAALPFQQFAGKKVQFSTVCDLVQAFTEDEKVKPWLEKLNQPLLREWMTPEDFVMVKTSCTKGRPALLVAGSTSSGKSTLLNALLGEAVLPTSHSASTSVLCEIKYSADPNKKFAIVHIMTDGTKHQECLDLTVSEDRKRFVAFVDKKKRGPHDFLSSKHKHSRQECLKVEIFWPLEFLQYFTLVDSPGVTEDDDDNSVARQITEQFQQDLACGFIYVLDATRAVEEAGQVGGLLTALFKGTKVPHPPGAALFVINKWDVLDRQARENYLTQIFHVIARRWDGLKFSQLVKMDAQMAAKTQQLGVSTEDMEVLCDGIKSILPEGINNILLKGCNQLLYFLDQIEDSTEGTIRALHLPAEERMQKYETEWKQLQSFKESKERGKIAALQKMIAAHVEHLVMDLATYLQSNEGYRFALKWKKSNLKDEERRSVKEHNVEYLIAERFCETIRNYEGYVDFSNWLNKHAMPEVLDILDKILAFRATISSNRMVGGSPRILRKAASQSSSESGLFDSSTMAWAVPVAILGAPVALAVGIVGAPIYAVVKLIRQMKFKKAVDKGYREMVEHSCSKNYHVLRDIVTCLLKTTLEPAKLALREIPELIDDLEHELKARVKQDEEDIPGYEKILELCQEQRGHVANFVLSLRTHDHTISDLEDWQFEDVDELKGQIVKKSLKGEGTVALKVWDEPITEENADSCLKEIQRFKRFKGNPHLISFYGSILFKENPLHLGLLFEYFDDRTLAEEIFNPGRSPPTHPDGFLRAKTIGLHILSGLTALHDRKVHHGRLSSETIVVAERGIVKIADFGLAKLGSVRNVCRDVAYMAPEVLEEQPIGYSSDIYSCGIILWEVWNGRPAYENVNLSAVDPQFVDAIRKQILRPGSGDTAEGQQEQEQNDEGFLPASKDTIHCKWQSLCSQCWSSSSRLRPSAKEALVEVKQLALPKCQPT